ncbi:MAG: single-stranded DNA-binding protein [Methylophaga sp.]|nr:single-stranded DNA-binding protein [Methylophaga sp.]
MNQYSFTGRIGKDSETRFTQGGMAICSFSVAVDYGYGENKGTNWLRCSLFGKRAEGKLPQYLVKGTQVAISGELRIREYDDKDGNKRTSVEVSVDKLDLIGGNQEASSDASQQPVQNQQQPQNQGGFPSHGGQQSNGKPDPFLQDGEPADDLPF